MTVLFSHWAEVSLGTGAVILLLLLLRPLLERACPARWRCWVWLILAARLVLPWSLSGPWSPFQLFLPVDSERPTPTAAVESSAEMTIQNDGMVQYFEADTIQPGTADTELMDQEWAVVLDGEVTPGRGGELPAEALLLLLWGLGTAAVAGVHAVAYVRFARRVRRWSRPAGTYEGLPVAECLAVETPLLLGFLHPTIVLPRGMEGEDRDFALLHEYTHFRRSDLWRKLLLLAANALHWWNPAAWLLRQAGERDIEMACDEAVLEGKDLEYRQRYGQALLHTITGSMGAAGAMTTGFALGMSGLKKRFAALVEERRRPFGRSSLALALCLALLGGTLVSCSEEAPGAVESLQPTASVQLWEESPAPSATPEADIWTGQIGYLLQGYDLEERTIEVFPVETSGSGLLSARLPEDAVGEKLTLAEEIELRWEGSGGLADFLAWPAVSGESWVLFCEWDEEGAVRAMGWVPCQGSSWTGVTWARCGTWDGEAQTFQFYPLTVDPYARTWKEREEGPWMFSLSSKAQLPPISLPANGTELDRETYLQNVFRAEPLENSEGDCLLRMTVVDGAIVEAQWLTPYQAG